MTNEMKVSLSATSLSAQPGDSSQTALTIQNTGGTVDSYNVEILGVDSSWFFSDSTSLANLMPGQTTTIRLIFQPPPTADSKAGGYKVGIQVTRTNSTAATVAAKAQSTPLQTTLELDLVVAPVPEFTVDINPRYISSRKGSKARVKITNTGNVGLLLDIISEEPDELLEFGHPAQVSVPADSSADGKIFNFDLEVTARQAKLTGAPAKYEFQLNIVPVQVPVITGGRGLGATTGGGLARWTLSDNAGVPGKNIACRYTVYPVLPAWLLLVSGLLMSLIIAGMVALLVALDGSSASSRAIVGNANAAATATLGEITKFVGTANSNATVSVGSLNSVAARQSAINSSNTVVANQIISNNGNTATAQTQATQTAQIKNTAVANTASSMARGTATATALIATQTATALLPENVLLSEAEAAWNASKWEEARDKYSAYATIRTLRPDLANRLIVSHCRYVSEAYRNAQAAFDKVNASMDVCYAAQ